jgi:3-hydroxyisobutyrate dehydrogenase-like beta-hydroxyacid dehydrogenase
MRIGFIGLGNIGTPMAGHVVAADHDVAVYDARAERMEPLVAAGARAATGPADAASGAELVSVVVLDDAQVLDVTTGSGGVVAAMTPGAVLAIHSTVTRDCLRAVDEAATARGVLVLDAGISGGVPGATAGTLLVIAGGAETTIEAARPGLEPWSRDIVRVGPIGVGMAAKIARNYIQYACWAAVHDGQALAQAAGVDLATFEHIVATTHAVDSTAATLRRSDATTRPVSELGDRGPALGQHAALGLKDLAVAATLAAEVGVELPGLPGARRGFAGSLGVRLDEPGAGDRSDAGP